MGWRLRRYPRPYAARETSLTRRRQVLRVHNSLPFLVWLVALGLALNSGWPVAYRLLYLFTFLIVASLVWSSSTVWALSVERQVMGRELHAGDTLVERFCIRNRSYLPQLWVVLEDRSDLPLRAMKQVVDHIGPRSERNFTSRTLCLRRGRYHLGPTTLNSGDPFSILESSRQANTEDVIIVYPRVFHLDPSRLLAGLLEAESRRSRRSLTTSTDVSTIRDYQPGDALHTIHWLSTAAQGRLISKEFEQTPGGNVWILIDMQRGVHAGSLLSPATHTDEPFVFRREKWPLLEPSTEEYAVSMAASLATYFLRTDRAVGLAAYSSSRVLLQPDRGERHRTHLLEVLAVLTSDGDTPFSRAIELETHNFRRHDTVILITPADDDAWVGAAHSVALRGIEVLAVNIDRQSFGGKEPAANIAALLSARRIPFCVMRKDQRPDEVLPPGR